jgi:hypothetical protein
VASVGSSVSTRSVKRLSVEKVWVQASVLLKPISGSGTPSSVAP